MTDFFVRASMADRLVNGLADEKVRWSKAVESFGVQEAQFVGDVLLASAFVSYVGAFNLQLRGSLVSEKWIPDMSQRKIPMTDGMHPLKVRLHRQTVEISIHTQVIASWDAHKHTHTHTHTNTHTQTHTHQCCGACTSRLRALRAS